MLIWIWLVWSMDTEKEIFLPYQEIRPTKKMKMSMSNQHTIRYQTCNKYTYIHNRYNSSGRRFFFFFKLKACTRHCISIFTNWLNVGIVAEIRTCINVKLHFIFNYSYWQHWQMCYNHVTKHIGKSPIQCQC